MGAFFIMVLLWVIFASFDDKYISQKITTFPIDERKSFVRKHLGRAGRGREVVSPLLTTTQDNLQFIKKV